MTYQYLYTLCNVVNYIWFHKPITVNYICRLMDPFVRPECSLSRISCKVVQNLLRNSSRIHSRHIDTKRHTLVQTNMLSLSYMPQQSVMTHQVSLHTMQCCELYMVSQNDNCELYLSSFEHIRQTRVFFVKNPLWKSYRICCVTRQESIHAIE